MSKLGILVIASVLTYCYFGVTFANPTTESSNHQNVGVTEAPPAGDSQKKAADGETRPGCSSSPWSDKPCDMEKFPGIWTWVTDSRKYEWIYMAFCITLGSCIFLFIISAAIYNVKTYKRKQAALLAHIREEDDRARAATIHGERRGSHLAQPRRSSLSVAIQEPGKR